MPNTVAYLVLFGSPFVIFIVFRLIPLKAAVATGIIGGYLLLPERTGVNLPVLPTIDKTLLPAVTVLVLAVLSYRVLRIEAIRAERFGHPVPVLPHVQPGFRPRSYVITALLGLLVLGAFATALTNGDPIPIGGSGFLPGLRLYDAFSLILSAATVLLPMFLARKYLADPEGHRVLLMVLAIGGFLYCAPALVEVRLSPQMSVWVYGFFPHSFLQHMREGGYRPVVFLNHGLWLSIILAMSFLSSLALGRLAEGVKSQVWFSIALATLVTLFLTKSLGAFLIVMVLAPFVVFAPKRVLLLGAVTTSLIILLYPLVRGAGLVPVDDLVAFAQQIDSSRAGSLQFRLRNEDELLVSALQRQLFGWGGWGRGQLYDFNGVLASVMDGAWIIELLQGGWVRYIAIFGLMTLPIVILSVTRRAADLALPTVLLSVVLVANLIDLIPNATLTPVTWLIAGALVGYLEYKPQSEAIAVPVDTAGGDTGETGDAGNTAMPSPTVASAPSKRYARNIGPRKVRQRPKANPAAARRRPR